MKNERTRVALNEVRQIAESVRFEIDLSLHLLMSCSPADRAALGESLEQAKEYVEAASRRLTAEVERLEAEDADMLIDNMSGDLNTAEIGALHA